MKPLSLQQMRAILEAALLVAGQPLNISALQRLFSEDEQPSNAELREHIKWLQEKYTDSGIELKEVASGYRFQTKPELSPWLGKLWEERAPRYSRAFLETLALIAYKQPITRGEIEEIRGVTVSSNIMKTLLEREWVKVLGYREVPGKPAILGTTKKFLDYFNLKSLADLPTLMEFKSLEAQAAQLQAQLDINEVVGLPDGEHIPEEQATVMLEETKIIAIHEANDADDDSAEDEEVATG